MISNLTPQSWDAKNIELGGSILQSWGWGEFQKSLGHKIFRFSDDDFLCLAVESDLSVGKKYAFAPRGPVGRAPAALLDLNTLSQDHNLIFLRLEPMQEVQLPAAIKEMQPKYNWSVALDQTEEELLIAMRPKTRYNLNLAQRKGVTVKQGGREDLLTFYELMMQTAQRNNFRLHPQNYYWQMWDALAPDNLKLLLAYYNNQAVAGLLMSVYGNTAIYLHGGSSQKFKEAMPTFLLHWEAMRVAKGLGMTVYDFGGVAPSNDPKHPWSGITRFKKSFGGYEVVYPGTFDLVFSPLWYNVYKNARKLRGILR